MPTVMSVQADDGSWHDFGRILPGMPPGTMSDNRPDGRHIIYIRCADDDSHSEIGESASGFDAEVGNARLLVTTEIHALKEVYPGEVHEIVLSTDISMKPRHIRISHYKEKR